MRVWALRLAAAGLAAASACGCGNATPVQESATDAAPPVACELHVWLADALESETEGAIRNHPRNFALHDKNGDPTPLATALSRQTQAEALASLDLARLLQHPGARLIVHADPAPKIVAGAPMTRHADSSSGCYAELILKHLVFAYSTFAGSSLQAVYQFSDFAGEASPVRSFSTMITAALPGYPGKGKTTDEQVNAQLVAAFRQDTTGFAAAATAPSRRRH